MKVRVLTAVAYGKRIVVVDFGNVAVSVDEHGHVIRYGDFAEVPVKWERSTPEVKLFLPREEEIDGMRKTIRDGKLVINGVEIGDVAELEFPIKLPAKAEKR
jgi:hypothetical protein